MAATTTGKVGNLARLAANVVVVECCHVKLKNNNKVNLSSSPSTVNNNHEQQQMTIFQQCSFWPLIAEREVDEASSSARRLPASRRPEGGSCCASRPLIETAACRPVLLLLLLTGRSFWFVCHAGPSGRPFCSAHSICHQLAVSIVRPLNLSDNEACQVSLWGHLTGIHSHWLVGPESHRRSI